MNEFRRRVALTICLLGSLLSVLFGIRQMVKDQESENIGYSAVRWDVPKFPYYTGGKAYRAPSSQGSTVPMPRVSSSSQQLFHHNAGGTYAGQGTGTYRSSYAQSTGRPVHTFSNGGIYSYGGGGGSGGASGVTSHRKASYNGSSVGHTAPSISISIPRARSYAYNNVQVTSSETPYRKAMPGRRKAPVYDPEADYEEGDETTDDTDPYLKWIFDGEEWITPVGQTKLVDGKLYEWGGSSWVFVKDQAGPDSPIGDVPWILLLLMVGGYTVTKSVRRKSCEQE